MSALIGFETLEKELQQQLSAGNIHHAHIISGPQGVGKASFALDMAYKIFEDTSEESLDIIKSKIVAGSYPNLLRIQRGFDDKNNRQQTEITKDQITPLYSFMRQTTADGGWRIIIVDRADLMNRTVQNALLKSLEEPGTKTIFFLTVENKSLLLPTILSRCQHHSVSALNYDQTLEYLNTLSEFQDTDSADQEIYAWLSQGCIGRCVHMIKNDTLELWRELLNAYIARAEEQQKGYLDFAEAIGKNRSYDESYETLASLIRFLWSEALFAITFKDKNAVSDLSEVHQRRLDLYDKHIPEELCEDFKNLGIRDMIKNYQSVDQELMEAKRRYLDKKVVILNVLKYIKTPHQLAE